MRRPRKPNILARRALMLGAALLALVAGQSARAHFLWLTAEREPGGTVVQAFLAEPPIPDLPMFMKSIEGATYSADGRELSAERGSETFVIRLPEESPRIIDGACDLGVMSREGATFRLAYTARVQLGPAPADDPESSDGLRVRLVEDAEGATNVRVTFDGKPAGGVAVRAYLEDGSIQELTADDEGMLDCPGVAEGRTGLLAKRGDGTLGEFEGKPFDETRHYATLTVTPIEAAEATGGVRTSDATAREGRPFALIPEPINSFGGAVLGHWLYVYSGHTGTTHRYHTGTTNPHFYRLDLRDRNTWEELPCGPPLQGVALVAHGGMLYRVGGMAAQNAEGEPHDLISVADVARFDPESRSWTDLPPLPEPRSTHDAAVLGDHLYVVGGWAMTGGDSADAYFHDDALRLDLSDPDAGWERLPSPPAARRALAVAAHDGKIFVLGGLTEEGRTVRDVEVFDPSNGSWSTGPELPGAAIQGFAPSAFEIGGRLHASGADGTVYRLSRPGDAWEPVGMQAIPRITHRLLPGIDGDVLIVGGNFAGSPVRFIESIPASSSSAESRAVSWTTDVPGEARRSQAVGAVGRTIVVAGGNRSSSPHAFEAENLTTGAFEYRPDGSAAVPIAPLPEPRQSGVLVAAPGGPRGSAYLLGGIGQDGDVVRTLGDVFRLEPSGTGWTRLEAEIPDDRGMFEAAVHNGDVWIFGGRIFDPRPDGDDGTMPTTILRWDADQDGGTFEVTEHQLPRPRRSFAGASLDGNYYLVGGLGGDQEPVETVDVFNFDDGRWSTIPAPERHRVFADLAVLEGRLYLGGGFSRGASDHFEPARSIEVYDPSAKAWKTVMDEAPVQVGGLRMVALGGRLVLLGHDQEGAVQARIAVIAPPSAPVAEHRAE